MLNLLELKIRMKNVIKTGSQCEEGRLSFIGSVREVWWVYWIRAERSWSGVLPRGFIEMLSIA